jgi:hypothetical protein
MMLFNSRDRWRPSLWVRVLRRTAPIICGLAILDGPNMAFADVDGCQDAIDAYNAALHELPDAIRLYANCVGSSHGHDDCSVEFLSLQSAQDEFETSVANYQGDCQ